MRTTPLGTDDRPRVLELLREAELPVSDLDEAGPARFRVLRDGGDVLASGALELYGAVALVRSVAVPAHRRGEGLGKRIVEALEREAAASGVTDPYLLTTRPSASSPGSAMPRPTANGLRMRSAGRPSSRTVPGVGRVHAQVP